MSHVKIWEEFFAQTNPDQYTILTHAKYPENVTQDFVWQHLIPEYCPSTWGEISLVRLFLKLFDYAFKDPYVFKAVNLSQSCIPLKSFQSIYEELTSTDKGFLDWGLLKFSGTESDTSNNYQPYISGSWSGSSSHISGYPPHVSRYDSLTDPEFVPFDQFAIQQLEGMCFSREMMEFFLQNDNTHLFQNMSVPDEHYFANNLIHYNKENLVERRHIHQCIYMGGESQGGLQCLSNEALQKLRHRGKLFVRKIAPGAQLPDLFNA